ncbi:MAG TPA: hypothetical protein ENJ09_01805 [Planctomycetes bacterium]|nr:hypothetical protein [Planctomycetota bacterium]
MKRWKNIAGTALALVLSVFVLARTVRNLPPAWNWDVLGYMGLALEWEYDDPADVHRETYAAAKRELPPEVYADLTAPSVKVRRARAADPAIFHEHIGFYRARVLPTYLVHLAHRFGAPLSGAVWGLAVVSFLLTACVFVLWLLGRVAAPWALLGGTLLAHAPPLLVTATYATPDSLGLFLIVLGSYLLLERKSHRGAALVFTLSILARPDAILFLGALAILLWWAERRSPSGPSTGFLAGWVAVSAALYLGVGRWSQGYGWWALFQISFLAKSLHPSQLSTRIDWPTYRAVLGAKASEIPGSGYWRTARAVTGSTYLFPYAAAVLLAFALLGERLRSPALRRTSVLLVALLATYTVRWFLFPQVWDRFFAPVYALVPMCLVSLASDVVGIRNSERARAQNASNDVTSSITSA